MKNYKFLITLAIAITAVAVVAVDKAEELKKLEAERAIITQQQIDKRIEILNTNEECRTLHNEIMALHRELALKMDANPDMHQLNLKADELDRKIDALSATPTAQ